VRADDAGEILEVSGNDCRLGLEYARAEMSDPKRPLTLSLPVVGSPEPVSVRTAEPVPLSRLRAVADAAKALRLAAPIQAGERVASDIAQTGTGLIATKTVG
jgi:CxxC motif-containing protein